MFHIKSLLLLVTLAVQVPLASSTVTYVVGLCEPKHFTTIQDALNASPSPNVIKICPGTYNEQIVIGYSVTLEGISSGNSVAATIAPPSGGLVVNATNDLGRPVAAQVFVQSSGQVNLTNLIVEGHGNEVTATNVDVVGVFYLGSPGILNHVTIQDQNGNGNGVGIWLQGGIPVPYVTVENSYIEEFDNAGIVAETNSSLSELSATITGNYVDAMFTSHSNGIDLVSGLTASVSGNVITGAFEGIAADGGHSSISKNTIDSVGVGIDIETDGVSVTSNTIYNILGGYGIGIVANSAVAPVTGNTVAQSPIGIYLECVAGANVHSNTVLDTVLGLLGVSGAVGANSYYNVGTINDGGC